VSFLEDIVKRQQKLQAQSHKQTETLRLVKKATKEKKTLTIGVEVPVEIHAMMKDVLKDQGKALGVDSLKKLALMCIKEHLERLDTKSSVA
jgi:hypothetical protein